MRVASFFAALLARPITSAVRKGETWYKERDSLDLNVTGENVEARGHEGKDEKRNDLGTKRRETQRKDYRLEKTG